MKASSLLWLMTACLGLMACRAGETPAVTDTPGTATATSVVPTATNPIVTATVPTSTPVPTREVMPTMTQDEERIPDADVLFVRAVQASDGTWTFDVTVFHPDTGWEDYADGWDVVTPDGQVLKVNPDDSFTRLLLHPHENEQPFVRGQSGIVIPEGVDQVTVRAHDLVDGFGGREVVVDLTAEGGSDYRVERP